MNSQMPSYTCCKYCIAMYDYPCRYTVTTRLRCWKYVHNTKHVTERYQDKILIKTNTTLLRLQ